MRCWLLLLVFFIGLAQAGDKVTVRSLAITGKSVEGDAVGPADIKMPVVQMADAKVAAKINDQLFIGQLDVMAPEKPGSAVVYAGGDGTKAIDFSVALDSQRVLTIAFDSEGCGAYCENYSTYYSFDTRNGHLVTVDELLTPAGMRTLAARMHKERIAQYKKQLALLRTELKAAAKKGTAKAKKDIGDLDDRIALNEDCLEQATAPDDTAGTGPLPRLDVELAGDAFRIFHQRCSNHASRALDDVDIVTLAIPYAQMRPYLTSYGKALVLNEGDTMPADSAFGQVLRGYLGGKMPVTMLLHKEDDNSVRGVYFYDKHRIPIALSGHVVGKELTLTESDDKGVERAKIKLTNSAGHLSGRWIGNKEMPLEFMP